MGGQLPDWVEVRGGREFCTLCWAYLDEAHAWSERHKQRLLLHERRGSPAASTENQLSLCALPIETVPPPLPVHYGDPRLFVLRPEWNAWYCRVCHRNADDNHIKSERHQKRAQWPEAYLGV